MLRKTSLARISALVAAVLVVAGIWQSVLAGQDQHPDHEVYRAAAAALRDGADPYLVSELERFGADEGLSLPYPPLAAAWLHVLLDHEFPAVAMIYVVCLVLAFLLCWPAVRSHATTADVGHRVPAWGDALELAAWFMAGFATTRWNFQTGNLGLLELFLFAIALAALRRGRCSVFALAIGLLGFLKLVPVVLTLLLLPAVLRRQVRPHMLLLPVVVFLCLHLLSFQLHPELTTSWLRSLFGGVEGQHTPWHEWTSGNANPTFALLVLDLVVLEQGLGLSHLVALVLVAGTAFIFLRLAQVLTAGREDVATTALLVLALLLLWPRLKPYSYGYALLPLALCAKELPTRTSLLLLCACAGLPMAMPWLPNPPTEALLLLKRNHLAVLLWFAALVLAVQVRWRQSSGAEPSRTGFRTAGPPADVPAGRTGDPPAVALACAPGCGVWHRP